MDLYERELREKWNSINYYSGGAVRLSVMHPLEWHVRYATPEQKSVVIVSERPAINLASSKSIEASCNQRKDGKYAISFTLMEKQQEDVFITMASDIIEFSHTDASDAALLKVIKRYGAWLKLLDHKHKAILGSNSQKGLIGELTFLKERMELGMKPSSAIAGWGGPDGLDQDFEYDDGWHEIKATGVSSASVSISSVEQLDRRDEGELIVYRIDKCAPTQKGATTLYMLIHYIIGIIQQAAETPDDFILKLASAGYIDSIDYDKQFYSVGAKQAYIVNDSFPRLRRSNVPSELINAEYQLSLPGLAPWAR